MVVLSERLQKVVVEHYRVPQVVADVLGKRARGKPNVSHVLRYKRNSDEEQFVPSAKGGFTKVTLVMNDGQEFSGVAWCSFSDNYSYKRGKDIAFGRVLSLVK